MSFKNKTKNQHFVPQVEQRLNAINPLANEDKQKIYCFSVIDRENYQIALDSESGVKISSNLSFNDLFSFDVLDKSMRLNFEYIFGWFEKDVKSSTEALLTKLNQNNSDVKKELLAIFVSKFVNFFRNPYSIQKILNTMPDMNFKPTDPQMLEIFESVLSGNKPQQNYLCQKFGISEQNYINWLSGLFLLLSDFPGQEFSMLESIVINLFNEPSNHILVFVCLYDDEFCLLSDRSFNMPIPQEISLSFDFNLTSHAFIRFVFTDLNTSPIAKFPEKIISLYKNTLKRVDLHFETNNLNMLENYNKNTLFQSHSKIFCASKHIYGVKVI